MADIKHDASYYLKCMFGGLLACGVTHAAICPLDVVKCRNQAQPGLYKSLGDGLSKISASKGFSTNGGLLLGFAPTFIGYSLQGLGKFGFYELFKDVGKSILGDENAVKYRRLMWSVASGSAEVIADTLLCPWEAVKVRMQTDKTGEVPTKLGEAFNKMKAEEGWGGLYKGLTPLWARQVPYTIVKFVAFEQIVELFYTKVFTKPRSSYSKGQQLSITFASGYIAGVFCAVVSHPADTIVSKLYSAKEPTTVGQIYQQIGFGGLWTGLGTRILMIGTLTGLQWWIYDTFKTVAGLGTSGGSAPAKKN